MNQRIKVIAREQLNPLMDLVERQAQMSFLIKGVGVTFSTAVSKLTDDNNLILKIPEQKDWFELKSLIEQHSFLIVNFNYQGLMWGFETKVLEFSAEGFSVKAPEKIFEINRRRSDRNRVPEDLKQITFAELKRGDKYLTCPVIDLSIDGFKIEILKEDLSAFVKEQIWSWNLMVNGRNLRLKAEVRNAYRAGDNTYYVGLRMVQIEPLDQVWIRKFCLEKLSQAS